METCSWDAAPERKAEGEVIMATYTDEAILVYQAYNAEIADYALRHKKFSGCRAFSTSRMTWIKPGFLWMMHRCGWGSKPNQERVLGIWLRRKAFNAYVAAAVSSKSQNAAKPPRDAPYVVVQWDPDHRAEDGAKMPEHRTIQLGLRNMQTFMDGSDWVAVEEVPAARWRRERLLVCSERVYCPVDDPRPLVAFRICYAGANYHGLAPQPGTAVATVLGVFLRALHDVGAIRSVKTSDVDLTMCGRTDAGVSAYGQVVALRVRDANVDFERLTRKALPRDIRVLAWRQVDPTFSVRHDCVARSYAYFFCTVPSLDLEAMKKAAEQFVGEHDFYWFCNPKKGGEHVSTVRLVMSAEIVREEPCAMQPHALRSFRIRAKSFLYHQVRKMMAVLLEVGRGRERADVITRLLMLPHDAAPQPRVQMAPPEPLVLMRCDFAASADGEEEKWRMGEHGQRQHGRVFRHQFRHHAVQSAVFGAMAAGFEAEFGGGGDGGGDDWQGFHHVPFASKDYPGIFPD